MTLIFCIDDDGGMLFGGRRREVRPRSTLSKTAEELGFEWLIVENDDPTPTGLEDIERSMKYLRDNGLA